MTSRIISIASNTFREAVRDRVLYNLIAFAVLLSGAAILVSQISIEIERLVVINLGLTSVSLFGVVIAIFIGIGLVSKEIDKRTLYTVLSRPVRRWEFIVGKFFGLAGTLVVPAACAGATCSGVPHLAQKLLLLVMTRVPQFGHWRTPVPPQ